MEIGLRTGVAASVAFLGLLAVILGIAAESSRFTVHGDPTGLGVSASLLLLISQIIVTFFGGCLCCFTHGKPPLPSTIKMAALICFSLSWFLFGLAFPMLFIGALIISSGGLYSPGTMAAGAALSLFVTGLAIAYYLLATPATPTSSMGDPPIQMAPVGTSPTKGQHTSHTMTPN